MNNTISEPKDFEVLIDTLYTAQEGDEVHLYLSTPGGDPNIGIAIVNALRNTKAKTVGHLMSICHSMGTFIFLECQEYVVNKDIIMLFHAYSGFSFGKGSDTVKSAKANHDWLNNFFRDVYYPFFSKEELDLLMPDEDGNGATDMYLTYEDVCTRLRKVVEHKDELDKVAHKLYTEELIDSLGEQLNEESTE